MGLLFITLGLLLPHQYQVHRSQTLTTTQPYVFNLLLDLKNWPNIMAWHRLAGVKNINVSTPSRGVGAHIELAHTLGHLEITIVKQSDNNLEFSLLINDEHVGAGQLTSVLSANETKIDWHLNGMIHSNLFGGYIALYCEFYLEQMIISALNNINTQVKLQAMQ
ncbi:hypothetical protein CWC18_17130 [Pseudoalteromonas aurantia]|uniref:SRPBCC family protein n=1 Tax=Pseudoalteromonas aurantia TaxID=43654 RepID=A0A5S3V5B1_9GAMM|nr:hypothetical protein CWC18_17130 [Pseudoalteromonas aurantia]TMO66195.1 hypothetical protein CWC19_16855 [Pseudoalteromonas aurantia]